MSTAGLAILIALTVNSGGAGADEHLLAGATAFREGDYARALVEFRVARKLGATGAEGYVAASLVKLDRPEEAIEAFAGAEGPGQDPLLDYYRALACYQARLYGCADRILAGLGARAGPRIAAQAAKVRTDITAALAPEPAATSIDWYLERCQSARAAGRRALASAFCAEAAALSARRRDHYRLSEGSPPASLPTSAGGATP